ncbi:hypothetical protein CFE70_009713 [Pyrenophora teres f. teres 0-1]
MPTVVLKPGTTVFVTGANGLIGSHVIDQLLKKGYNVRGTVRDAGKAKWLNEYFDAKYKDAKLELVSVPDMRVEGCYDSVVDGALNALKACAKTPSCKRFVFTSSSIAATFPRPNVEFSIDETSYNDEAMEVVRKEPGKEGLFVYAALKTEAEKAVWKWTKENKPAFVVNTVLPNANFGRVLVPEHQGYPSTVGWVHDAWVGSETDRWTSWAGPQWFISTEDDALLHVSALIHSDVDSERLFGFAEPWNYNQMMDIWRKQYPERKFGDNIEGMGVDRMKVPNERTEEVLRWVKGAGWDSLEQSLKQMTENWK